MKIFLFYFIFFIFGLELFSQSNGYGSRNRDFPTTSKTSSSSAKASSGTTTKPVSSTTNSTSGSTTPAPTPSSAAPTTATVAPIPASATSKSTTVAVGSSTAKTSDGVAATSSVNNSAKGAATGSVNEKATVVTKKNVFAYGNHLVGVFAGGGLSTFNYSPTYGSQSNGLGFTFGFDYSYLWHPKWGVNVGLTVDSYGSKLDLGNTQTSYYTSDGDFDNNGVADNFYLITTFHGLVEKQRSYLFGVPISFRFYQPVSPRSGFFIGLGAKLSFDLSSTSAVAEGGYSTHGYYPQYSGAADSLNFNNIQGFTAYEPRGKATTKIGFGVSAIGDISYYFKINKAWTLYGGPYFEYQINEAQSNPDLQLVEYNTSDPKNITCDYQYALKSNVISAADRLAFGGKVGLLFDFAGNVIRKKDLADKAAQLNAAEAARRAEEARLLAEARLKAQSDSLANLATLADIRNRAMADSIAYAQKLASEALRLAELKLLAEQQRLRDSIANAQFNSKNVAVIMDIRTKKLNADERNILKLPIVFEMGSANITSDSKVNAQKIGEMLSHHPDLAYRITGHTCDLGNDDTNYLLGLRRAQTLYKEFAKAGVMSEQITTFSKGETEPLMPNVSEDNRRRNRRVVVLIEDIK